MAERESGHLEDRIARLEITNRRSARLTAGFCIVGLVALGSLFGSRGAAARTEPADRDEISATRFSLVSDSGLLLASLYLTAEGEPRLEFYDAGGIPRLSLEHGSAGTALYLRDGSGTTRIGAAQFPHGGGGFAIHGEESEGATVLYMSDGHGRLSFYSRDGRVIEEVAPPTEE